MADKILNIAHRGARSLAPENTIPAAKKAFEIGADFWELDCGMLVDEALIVLHDDSFKRTTNIDNLFPDRKNDHISTFTLSEVLQLDAGSFFVETDPFEQISAGNVSEAEQTSFIGLQIPTLEQALVFTREIGWNVNVEIKNMHGSPGDSKIAARVVHLIQSLNMQQQVIISSFNHRYLQQCKSLDTTIHTAALVEFQKPWDLRKSLSLGCSAYHPPVYAVTPRHIRRARENGLDVNVWTVNEPDKMKSLIEAGATGIITDFPQRMQEITSRI